jgi:hypothetical protein
MTTAIDSLRTRLRIMVDDVGTAVWTDTNLSTIMHQHRQRVLHDPMEAEITYSGAGTYVYKIYHSRYDNFEAYASGAADAYQVEDGAGAQRSVGTVDAVPDYETGIVTMGTDQQGTALYVSGWSYDLNAAAADLWQERAAKTASYYDVGLDGHSLSRSQWTKQCKEMADLYASRARPRVVNLWQ